MNIGIEIRRTVIQPVREKKQQPLQLPEPALIPVPWPRKKQEPALVPARQEVKRDRR